MPLVRYVSEQRRQQILSHAEPHLEPGEEVRYFARARDPESRKKGFVFMTDRRLILVWKGQDEQTALELGSVTAWGVNHESRGGPTLCIETAQGTHFAQLLTTSRAMTEGAIHFLLLFGENVPESAEARLEDGGVSFDASRTLDVHPEQLTTWELTKRILVTVLGVVLIVGAPIIAIVPGPWSILLVIAGLAILATEYDWAEDALDWAKLRYNRAKARITARRRARRQAQS